MKRLLCIVLILLLLPGMALGEGVALSFTAQDSKLWPQGAAEALNTLLDGMTLTVDDTGAGYALPACARQSSLAVVKQRRAADNAGTHAVPVAIAGHFAGGFRARGAPLH